MNSPQLCALLILLTPLAAAAQEPSISHTVPATVVPGETVELTVFGDNLAGAGQLWTSFPAKVSLAQREKNGKEKNSVTFRLQVDGQAPLGIGGLRVATDRGVSNLRMVLVDDLPTRYENGKNQRIADAQPIAWPAGVEGKCAGESFEYYKLEGKKGQRVSVEVFAARFGSELDPVIRLLSADGKTELAYSDDEGGIAPDCRFAHTFAADGSYLLELRDIRYQGGDKHRYRLRVGNFPQVTSAYPLAAKQGSEVEVRFVGADVEDVAPVQRKVPQNPPGNRVWVAARRGDGQGSAIVSLIASTVEESLEQEPNDKPEEANALAVPGAVNGRFEMQKDRDYFRFSAKKGQRILFRGVTRTLGSPTDLYLRLMNKDGRQLADAEDSGTSEGVLDARIGDDGDYLLVVEDLHRRGGPEHAYRIVAEPYSPGFSLSLFDVQKKNDAIDAANAPQGGVFQIRVACNRRDYNGPIELSVDGLDGAQLGGQTIAEKKNDTNLSVTLPDGIRRGELRMIRIVGRATEKDKDYTDTADVAAGLRRTHPSQPFPPPQLAADLALGVGPVFPDFFVFKSRGPIVLPQLIGSGSFKLEVERKDKFGEKIDLAVEGLPENVKAEVKEIAKGKNDATVKLTGPADLPAGEHKFRIVGTGTHKSQPKRVVAELVLKVAPPLGVAIEPAGALEPGKKQKVKVRVTRYGGEKQPVMLALKNLPAGVSAPEKLEVPGDKNELEFELTAADDAAVGKIENLIVNASSKVKGKDVSVDSPPAALEVKK